MVRIPQEAEDLAQEAFIRAYTNIDSYETDRKFSTWLFRIATNLSIDYLRKRKPDTSLDAEISGTDGYTIGQQVATADPLPEQQLLTRETQEWVQKAIMSLPVKYRSAIILKYIQDLSLKEISEILEIPVATVKTRIHRGREALKQALPQR
jgi:RNA polymerase sigma-70 factor (ECF subfamily)